MTYFCINISMETIFMNTKSRKIIESHKFTLILPQILNLKNSETDMLLFKSYLFMTHGKILGNSMIYYLSKKYY